MRPSKIFILLVLFLFINVSSLHSQHLNEDHEILKEGYKSQKDNFSLSKHFVWGAEIGTSIDISGYDSSTFNLDAVFGYRNSLFNLLGAGIGFHRGMESGDNYVPLYAVLRTSFTRTPKLFFMSLKVGYSFNTIGDASTFGDINSSLGAGINLASSKTMNSYIILAYEFRHFNEKHRETISIDSPNISMASLTLGFNF